MSTDLEQSNPTDQHQQEPPPPSSDASKKSTNSYYYWHGHEKDRAKAGDVAPMPTPLLVKKMDNVVPVTATMPHTITKYSWSDGDKSVAVYIDTHGDAQESMLPESLRVEFKKRQLIITYTAVMQSTRAHRIKQLSLRLLKTIVPEKSSYKVKEPTAQIVVRLVKKESHSWWELVDKNDKNDNSDNVDSDKEKDDKKDNEE